MHMYNILYRKNRQTTFYFYIRIEKLINYKRRHSFQTKVNKKKMSKKKTNQQNGRVSIKALGSSTRRRKICYRNALRMRFTMSFYGCGFFVTSFSLRLIWNTIKLLIVSEIGKAFFLRQSSHLKE